MTASVWAEVRDTEVEAMVFSVVSGWYASPTYIAMMSIYMPSLAAAIKKGIFSKRGMSSRSAIGL